MKKDIIEISLDNGSLMYIEAFASDAGHDSGGAFADVSYKESKVFKAAKDKVEQSLDSVKYIGNLISNKLKEIQPDKTEIEFGIKFNTSANIIISSVAQEANFKVKLTWNSNNAH